jgi:ribosomal protein L16 Arg81 hydroxylase
VSEDHFDNERNFIAVLGGERRYLLSHPNNCKDSYLYPMKHPLERHTQVDWFSPDLTKFPNFEHVHANEVVLQAGDVMYLPTYWFHHIVSLSLNFQCNVRSGHSLDYDQEIYDCGFLYPWPDS